MYAFLRRFLPSKPAIVVLALWYALLMILVYALSVGAEGEFRYLRM